MLNETSDVTFKAYLISKIQGWFLRWGRDEPAAPPPLPAPAQGSPALQRWCVHRRCKCRMTTRTGGGLGGGAAGGGLTGTHWHGCRQLQRHANARFSSPAVADPRTRAQAVNCPREKNKKAPRSVNLIAAQLSQQAPG